jgi:phage/plasmid-associated DNA primase
MDADANHEALIARHVHQFANVCTLEETGEICVYNSGCFHRAPPKEVPPELNALITRIGNESETVRPLKTGGFVVKPYKLNGAKRAEIAQQIRSTTYCSLLEFDSQETRLNVDNKVIYIRPTNYGSRTVPYWTLDHPAFNATPPKCFSKLPVSFNPFAKCPAIDDFLEKVFGADNVPLVHEMLAYGLMAHVRRQKAFLLLGPPSSGKSTFVDFLKYFFGGKKWYQSISEIELQKLGEPFKLANLRDKWWNVFDDLSADVMYKKELFQIVVTNMFVSAEIKHVQGDKAWKNRCKQLYTCNEPPLFKKDPGDQFWRRWIILECFAHFKNADQMTEDDWRDARVFVKDPNAFEKITTKTEMSGLLNKLLSAWLRLEKRGYFAKKWDDIDYVRSLWTMNTNAVQLFVKERCELDPTYEVDYQIFYDALNEFRASKGAASVGKGLMTRHLGMLKIPGFDKDKKISKKHHPRSCGRNYVGLRIKTEFAKDLKVEGELNVQNLFDDRDEVGGEF